MNNPLYLFVFNLDESGKFIFILAITVAWAFFWMWRGIYRFPGGKNIWGAVNIMIGFFGMPFIMTPLIVYLNGPLGAEFELVHKPHMIPAYTCQTYTIAIDGFE